MTNTETREKFNTMEEEGNAVFRMFEAKADRKRQTSGENEITKQSSEGSSSGVFGAVLSMFQ